jgi:hypothetical protein
LSNRCKPGEVWLVRVGNNDELTKMQVKERYMKTVEVNEEGEAGLFNPTSKYYAWEDVEFVEKLK